jgi:hypothetical protein
VSWKADYGTPITGAGAATLAGGVGRGRRANRNAPAARRVPRQGGRAVTPLGDRLGPFVEPPLEPVSDRMASMGASEHGHDRVIPSAASWSGMIRISGREIDAEAGVDRHRDQTPFADGDRIIGEHRPVGEGDD